MYLLDQYNHVHNIVQTAIDYRTNKHLVDYLDTMDQLIDEKKELLKQARKLYRHGPYDEDQESFLSSICKYGPCSPYKLDLIRQLLETQGEMVPVIPDELPDGEVDGAIGPTLCKLLGIMDWTLDIPRIRESLLGRLMQHYNNHAWPNNNNFLEIFQLGPDEQPTFRKILKRVCEIHKEEKLDTAKQVYQMKDLNALHLVIARNVEVAYAILWRGIDPFDLPKWPKHLDHEQFNELVDELMIHKSGWYCFLKYVYLPEGVERVVYGFL